MNGGLTSWFLHNAPNSNFKELHEKVMMYEELQWNVAPAESSKVSVHALTNYIRGTRKKQNDEDKGHHRATTGVNGGTSKTMPSTSMTWSGGSSSCFEKER